VLALHTQVAVVGGGAGGLAMASSLGKVLPPGSIAVVEPSSQHYYQPGWTLVGGKDSRRAPPACHPILGLALVLR
jgi:2-polyprenyl-6-methoxyphenol hydroxylase-like FAD-dependent oxidoreductase